MDPKIQKFIKKLKNVWVQRVRKFATLLVNTILFIIHELKKEANKQHANANSSEERRTIDGGMGVDLIKYITDADAQVAGAHDIKIKLKSNLHRHLTNKGLSINKNNLGIKLSIPTENSNITVNALVYPKIIQLDIGCTKETYSDDDTGRRQLASLLGYIWKYLCEYSGHQADIPAPQEWILTHYHYGKDGKMEYDGEKFHITAFNALGEFIRAYSKRRLDGSTIVRIEEVRTQKITIGAFLRKGGASRK